MVQIPETVKKYFEDKNINGLLYDFSKTSEFFSKVEVKDRSTIWNFMKFSLNRDPLEFMDTIPQGMFFGIKNIEKLVIPNSIKAIKAKAFIKANIDAVIIPESVTEIQNGAFANAQIVKIEYQAPSNRVDLDTIVNQISSVSEIVLHGNISEINLSVPSNFDIIVDKGVADHLTITSRSEDDAERVKSQIKED